EHDAAAFVVLRDDEGRAVGEAQEGGGGAAGGFQQGKDAGGADGAEGAGGGVVPGGEQGVVVGAGGERAVNRFERQAESGGEQADPRVGRIDGGGRGFAGHDDEAAAGLDEVVERGGDGGRERAGVAEEDDAVVGKL